jgi:hypothetical protein
MKFSRKESVSRELILTSTQHDYRENDTAASLKVTFSASSVGVSENAVLRESGVAATDKPTYRY